MTEQVRAATGASESADATEAGLAAAAQAMAGLDGRKPALVVVYLSVRYDLPALLAAIRSVTGDAPLVGATSTGHFHGPNLIEPERGVAVMAMTGGPYTFGITSVGNLTADSVAAGVHLARSARAAAGAGRAPYAAMLLLADGLALEQQALVTGIHQVTGTAVPVVGGGASDDRRLSETFVLHDDQVLTDSAVAVWIGSQHPIRVTVGHGWHPISLPMLVTKVDGQAVLEIAGQPAREVFESHIRQGNVDELDRVRPGGYYSTHAFGLVEPDGSHLIRGVFLHPDGTVRTFAPLPVYSAIQVVACDEADLLDVSHQVADEAVGDSDASVLLVFSCVARLDVLQTRAREEAARMHAAAGGIPVFGIYTYGEFARTTSVAGYHNSTVAAIAL